MNPWPRDPPNPAFVSPERLVAEGTVRKTGRGFFLSVSYPDPWRKAWDFLAPFNGKRVRVTVEVLKP